jgi:phosphatidylglycerophosphatase A
LGFLAVRILPWQLAVTGLIVVFLAGVWVCKLAAEALGQQDPGCVVFDEVWAMAAVIVAVPQSTQSFLLSFLAFALFRLFDIAKPPPLRRMEGWPGGWGVMADDLGAAVYAAAVLQGIIWMRT